jgi:predicted site-specific integrase-resolvase
MKPAVLYARVSSREQERELSLVSSQTEEALSFGILT